MALSGELSLEEAVDLSLDRLRNERIYEFPAVGPVLSPCLPYFCKVHYTLVPLSALIQPPNKCL